MSAHTSFKKTLLRIEYRGYCIGLMRIVYERSPTCRAITHSNTYIIAQYTQDPVHNAS